MRWLFCYLLLALIATPSVHAADSAPAYLLRIPASVPAVFIAETSKFALHRYENASPDEVRYTGASYMSIGQNGDGKQRNGDRRTPLGIYFVTEQLDTERMHEKYGIAAFVLDYPNVLDTRSDRSGDGIWLHGVDSRGGKRPALDTDGCLALPNEDLAQLEPLLVPNITPVIIGRTIERRPKEEINALRQELEAVVTDWSASLAKGDMYTHLSLYGEDFQRWGIDKSEWTALVLATVGTRPITAADVSDLLLLADPVEDGLYLSRFRLAVTEGGETQISMKRLYWRRSASGALQIVAEDAG